MLGSNIYIAKQKANPNAIFVRYAEVIASAKEVKTTPAPMCTGCPSVFTPLTGVIKEGCWTCFFCGKENPILPGTPLLKEVELCTRYPLKSDAVGEQDKDIRFLFLIDKSGSMTPDDLPGMEGKSPIKVLMSIIKTRIDELSKDFPQSKFGFIFFNHTIKILGDACGPMIEIEDKSAINSEEKLKAYGEEARVKLYTKPISESKAKILANLRDDDATSRTALGPAIVVGLEMLKGCMPGSKMIIVTDGLSNVGLGDLEDLPPAELEKSKKCYLQWASKAREMAVEITLYTISHTNLDPSIYFEMARQTNGEILSFKPDMIAKKLELGGEQEEFSYKTTATLILPAVFKFWKLLEKEIKVTSSIVRKTYGRIVANTKELYKIIVDPKIMPYQSLLEKEKIPIQLVLNYTGKDKKSYVLVYTKEFKLNAKRCHEADVEAMREYIQEIGREELMRSKIEGNDVELQNLVSSFMKKSESTVENSEVVALRDAANVIIEEKKKAAGEAGKEDKGPGVPGSSPSKHAGHTVEFNKKKVFDVMQGIGTKTSDTVKFRSKPKPLS